MRKPAVVSILILAALATLPALPASAADFLPVGAKARITVDFTYESSDQGADRKVHEWNWKSRRTVHIETVYAALKPTWTPAMEAMDASQVAASKNAAAKSMEAFNASAPMMGGAMAAMQKCGNDEACLTAEVMKMSANVDPAQMAKRDKAQAAADAAGDHKDRYQRFEPTAQTASYTIDETADFRDRDPLYIGWPQDTRIQTEERKGSGAVVAPPGTDAKSVADFKGTGQVEHDIQKNTLIIRIPEPMWSMPYTEHVMSSEKSGRMVDRGTRQKTLNFRNSESEYSGEAKLVKVEIKGDWKNQSGTYTVKQPGGRWNGGTLTARWKFEVL
ncbi:hypothetical protein BH10PSE17_BH10PSE17_29660 [soil metagenome]